MASIEGNRGMPRAARRRSRPSRASGGKPTIINNVETYANVALDHRPRAPSAFAAMGTEKTRKGTKVFSLAGKVRNGGLVEVPMGTTLREIVYDIGGGMLPGRDVQGRAARRPLGRLPAGRAARHADRLREPRRDSARSWARAAWS